MLDPISILYQQVAILKAPEQLRRFFVLRKVGPLATLDQGNAFSV